MYVCQVWSYPSQKQYGSRTKKVGVRRRRTSWAVMLVLAAAVPVKVTTWKQMTYTPSHVRRVYQVDYFRSRGWGSGKTGGLVQCSQAGQRGNLPASSRSKGREWRGESEREHYMDWATWEDWHLGDREIASPWPHDTEEAGNKYMLPFPPSSDLFPLSKQLAARGRGHPLMQPMWSALRMESKVLRDGGAREGQMENMEHSHYRDKLGQTSTSLGLDFFIIIMRQLDHMQFVLPSSSDILRFDESTLHLCLKRFFKRITSKKKVEKTAPTNSGDISHHFYMCKWMEAWRQTVAELGGHLSAPESNWGIVQWSKKVAWEYELSWQRRKRNAKSLILLPQRKQRYLRVLHTW